MSELIKDAGPAMLFRNMTASDFAQWGLPEVAYVKRIIVNDEEGHNEVGWAIHAANGAQMGLAPSHDLAFAAVRQHDLEPFSTH